MSRPLTRNKAGGGPGSPSSPTAGGASEESVRVICRVRPFNQREIDIHEQPMANRPVWDRQPLRSVVEFSGNQCSFLDPDRDWVEREQFIFDACLWSIPSEIQASDNPFASQTMMFDLYGTQLLKEAWRGFNTCLFAYGQTGSGKSYSLTGTSLIEDKENAGLIPRVCKALFEQIEERNRVAAEQEESEYVSTFKVSVQYLEIYNEQVKDLLWSLSELSPEMKAKINFENLKIRFNPTSGVFVEHLTSVPVSSWMEMMDLIDLGNESRVTAATAMNQRSSRSHALFKVTLVQLKTSLPKQQFEKPHEHIREACINLVDLAGSERNKKTKAEGQILKEAANINKSLFALKTVIDALAENSSEKGGKRVLIPYRTSHLTNLLSDSLGGNYKTFMLITVSPSADNAEETLQTLRYGSKARSIVSVVHVNENVASRMMMDLEDEIRRMKEEVQRAEQSESASEAVDDLKAQIAQQEAEMEKMNQEMGEQQIKIAQLEREKELQQRHRQWVALIKMDEMTKVSAETAEVAEREAALRQQMEKYNSQIFDTERRKVDMLNEAMQCRRSADDLQRQKTVTEAETDLLRRQVHNAESARWEAQCHEKKALRELSDLGHRRIAHIMIFRLKKVRAQLSHASRVSQRAEDHLNNIEAQKHKFKKGDEEVQNLQAQEISRLQQERANLRSKLSVLKTRLTILRDDREAQMTRLEERREVLQQENRRRREALASRITSVTASYDRKYNNMVQTMVDQYKDLIEECTRRQRAEEDKKREELREVHERHAGEVLAVEKKWKQAIDNAIRKGKQEFSYNTTQWHARISEREDLISEERERLLNIHSAEVEYSAFNRIIASCLDRVARPKSATAQQLYDLLELYSGYYDEYRPSRTQLTEFLAKDVTIRCEDPPIVGIDLFEDGEDLNSEGWKTLLQHPSMWESSTRTLTPHPKSYGLSSPRRAMTPTPSTLFFPATKQAQSPLRAHSAARARTTHNWPTTTPVSVQQ